MRRHPSRLSRASALLVGAVVVVTAMLVALGPATAAFAEETPSPTAGSSPSGAGTRQNLGPQTAGEAKCTVSSTAVDLASGMVATNKGIVVVEAEDSLTLTLYTLNAACKATPKTYPAANPFDTQDMAVGQDGTIWVADIGDIDESRTSVAVWKIPPGASTATIYRMKYQDGKHDAKAMLLDKDNVPIIIARSSAAGKYGIYRPTKPLVANTKTNLPPLEKVAEFVPEKTGTANPLNTPGQTLVTGAAQSPDGSRVVIRTYSDAYEFDVTNNDIVASISSAVSSKTYRITPLPDEPHGEAITYSADGKTLLTVSQRPQGASAPKLLSYTPFVPPVDAPPGDPGGNLPAQPGGGQSWFDKLTFSELTRIVAAVGVVGLVLAIAGIAGIRRARRRRREEEEYGYDDYDDEPPSRRRGGRRRAREDEHGFSGLRGSSYQDGYDPYGQGGYGDNGYGGGYADAGYGGGAAAGAAGGGTYGANGYGGEQYGGTPYAAPQYGADQSYAAGQSNAADTYGQQYGGQAYSGGQYDAGYGQQYGGQEYGGQHYGGDAYGQQSGDGQSHPGYGYEDDFDPLQDPRRR